LQLIERVWSGKDALSRGARITLTPLEAAYRAVTALRGWMYDRSLLRVDASPIPTVSIGNLSVGGTGKTPFAAYVASELARRGALPAVVLRGYGGDEPLVHARLNPEIPVVVEGDRAEGIRRAGKLGATVAVLDDAFQHRAASRIADVVLVAADQWDGSVRLLPAGPWREPLSALKRASLAVVTRKTADKTRVDLLADAIREAAPEVPQLVVRFSLGELRRARKGGEGESLRLAVLAGQSVIAIAGIADAGAFFRQLSEVGAAVTAHAFPDHHRFSSSDIAGVLDNVRGADAFVVCTLKDAVKLGPIWPATAPALWYVSQALEVESGGNALEKLLSKLTPNDVVRS
jgi:tetraacyldisaccharide 4'-kinase